MLQVVLHSLTNASPQRQVFAKAAITQLQAVVNDERFIATVRSANYTGRRFRNDAGQLVNASNELITQIIGSGKERRTTPNGIIDLQATFARLTRSATIGYVSPPSPLITTNETKAATWQAAGDYLSLAAHWMHEWMHVAGFRHKPGDRTDVAYSIGNFVRQVGIEQANEKGLDRRLVAVLGVGYLEASKKPEDSCPCYESCVPEDFID